ncbi:MAG: HAD-IB family phosphatase [Candidatus Brocadiaceae bacterium]|nr:HAD-IB family phosphatase [Candidatus Brocadiaceae bacterium]
MKSIPVKKMIIVDVDGVLFKGHYLLYLSRYLGKLIYLRAILLCILFNIDKILIQEFVEKVYFRFKGVTLEQARSVYKSISIIKNAKETIETIRNNGYMVVLVSSGVPDLFVKDLAARLSADDGFGIDIGMHNGQLTGTVSGKLCKNEGKVHLIENLLQKHGFTWKQTISLVDDRNNLDIMQKVSINVGVNAHYPVRRKANYLIDSGNFAELLDILEIADADSYKAFSSGMRKQFTHSWYQEIRRKLLHILIACVPPFSHLAFNTTLAILFSSMIVYMISECLRINGFSLPFIGKVTNLSIRKAEQRGIAFGPLTLVLGACLSLIFFPITIASTVIWIVAFADTAATIVGRSIGKHPLLYNKKKSVEGVFAGWVVAFFCGCVYIPVLPALFAGFFSSIIESFPFKALDNLFIPLATGILLLLMGYN